jgi:hypothetical protein
VTNFRTQSKLFEKFYQTESDFTVCNDVDGILAAINMRQVPEEWWLFIDASKVSLKAVYYTMETSCLQSLWHIRSAQEKHIKHE